MTKAISKSKADEILQCLPADVTLRMPAEWEAHKACLILFPHNSQVFRLKQAQQEVLNVARAIVKVGNEPVYLLVKDEASLKILRSDCLEPGIHLRVCPSDDTWVRDTGPTFCFESTCTKDNELSKERLVGINWEFNAYGGPDDGCYWPCDQDRQVATNICRQILRDDNDDGVSIRSVSMVLEGGSFHTDGDGTLLVTKECLLNKNRNPDLSQEDITLVLKRCLGVEQVIWLPNGLDADEDTNGHVDNFCCFVEPSKVLLAWTDDNINDPENYERCREALGVLSKSKDAKGRDFEVIKLMLPSPPLRYTRQEAEALKGSDPNVVDRESGEKMAASYINFYISNKAIVAPQFGVSTDGAAIKVLSECFPNRTVVGVESREILLGGGNIHCITQQICSAS